MDTMAKQKFQFFAASHLVLIKDGSILLSRRFNTGWGDGKYSIIAGHIDGNETVAQCIVRESKEEGNLIMREEDLEVVHTLHRITDYGAEYMDFFLVPKKWSGEPEIMEKDKCDDLRWFPLESLPENMVPYIRYTIEKIRAGITFSEFSEK